MEDDLVEDQTRETRSEAQCTDHSVNLIIEHFRKTNMHSSSGLSNRSDLHEVLKHVILSFQHKTHPLLYEGCLMVG